MITRTFPVMGTVATFRSPDRRATTVVDRVQQILHEADARFSPYRADSELCRAWRDPLLEPSEDMTEVLAGARLMEVVTDGAFRPRDNRGRHETTGYVKGWAMRRVETAVREQGVTDFLLAVGGDVVAGGRHGERPWQVAVRHPARPGGVAEVLAIDDAAIATSGDYERGAHIWGRRDEVRGGSVTVVGPRIDVADALATALWAADGTPAWRGRFPQYGVLWLAADGEARAA
ncbi:MAG: FAD:protein FMN transferase [Candidatus Nanopelagicales bacterium]